MQWDTILFFAGTGVLLMTTGITQADWKHRYLITALLSVAGGCVVIALLGVFGIWPYLAMAFPTATGALSDVAGSPISWFSVIILALAANLAIKSNGRDKPTIFSRMLGRFTGRPALETPHQRQKSPQPPKPIRGPSAMC